ncbi:DUF6432 family protein [Halorarum halobium]|uniref:DUF6432 family protein n=1 Tax=Halorarum halobium TaxID=3075121 RepID=UPI0028AFBEA4|nr:DUF6432 family protein [Halobaculum sp. XH14]
MKARPEFRDRADVDVAVLDALVGRREDGMTVLELRSGVDAGIDELEEALARLKEDGLIEVDDDGDRIRIFPENRVVPDPGEAPEEDGSILDAIRDRFGL